jgi:hypothetical protein
MKPTPARRLPFLFLIPISFVFLQDPVKSEDLQKCEKLSSWAPASIIGYAEAKNLGPRLRSFFDSPKLKRLLDSSLGKAYLQSEDYSELMENLGIIEEPTGQDPLDLFDALLGKEFLLGSRLSFAGGQETLLLTRTGSPEAFAEIRKAFALAFKASTGIPFETRKFDHEEHPIEQIGDLWFSELGGILAATNSKKLLEETIDLAYDRTEKSAGNSPSFSQLSDKEDFLIRASIRPTFIPLLAGEFGRKLDNPVLSLLVSGFSGALRNCKLLSATVDSSWSGINLGITLHADDRGFDEKYAPFFPKTPQSDFQPNIHKRGLLGSIRLSRNVYEWWENSEAFLEPQAAGSLAQFSAALSMFFGGLNFQDEVLPQLGETISLVFKNPLVQEGASSPSPLIPGGALIIELKDAKKFGRPFIVAFNSLVSILNITRMQQDSNAPSMLVRPEKVGKVDCYRVDLGLPGNPKNPGIEYNFSPSLAVTGNRVILGSTFDLVKLLVEESEKVGADGKTVVPTYARDRIYIDGRALRSILGTNLDFLAAQQVVSKGISLEDAKKELAIIGEILSFARDLELESFREKDAVRMKLRLGLISGNTIVEPPD